MTTVARRAALTSFRALTIACSDSEQFTPLAVSAPVFSFRFEPVKPDIGFSRSTGRVVRLVLRFSRRSRPHRPSRSLHRQRFPQSALS
jgi:hypothetical protein